MRKISSAQCWSWLSITVTRYPTCTLHEMQPLVVGPAW